MICEWTYDDDPTYAWETGCGNMFAFTDDGPKENGFRFCCYCGGELKVAANYPETPDSSATGESALRRMSEIDKSIGETP